MDAKLSGEVPHSFYGIEIGAVWREVIKPKVPFVFLTPALAPRLLTAFGTDRDRFEVAGDLLNLSGIGPVRIASGKKTGKSASVHCRRACPKFLRQSFHEFGECSIRYCPWAQACYQAQRGRGKGHHAAVRAVTFKWIRILFACWKQRTPYDPQRYFQPLQTPGSHYAQTTPCHTPRNSE